MHYVISAINVCFKNIGTKGISVLLLLFVPVFFLKYTLEGASKEFQGFEVLIFFVDIEVRKFTSKYI